jgi:acetyl-CoA carboxylase carboxyltransferase component
VRYQTTDIGEPDLSRIADAHVVPDDGGFERARNGALRPGERLRLLADEGSLQILRSEVTSERMGNKARPGDGVIGGWLRTAGRPVVCFAQDASYAGGSLGAKHADTIVRIQRLARQARVPVIGFVESGGARMQEGLAALDGYARIFSEHVALSGEVPQISVITGTSAGGGCYSPALTDFVVMTENASMFLTGPGVVGEVTGEKITAKELGGPAVHGRNGVCHFTVPTDVDAIFLTRQLLTYLPASKGEALPIAPAAEPAGPDPGAVVPLDARRIYDVRAVIDGIVDADSFLEASPHWAPNLVTGFARIEGGPIGIVANQPRHLAGVIDVAASEKGAEFVRTCNAFGVPLVVLVDTPGFLPGSSQEALGVIRHGAKLLRAFAASTVPRFTVVLRKSFGGAYITMNSKDLGADLYLAWSRAELGIMGADQAMGVVHRRALAVAADPVEERRRLAEAYSLEHLTAQAAARTGAVDEVIRPGETRVRLACALSMMTRSYRTRAEGRR